MTSPALTSRRVPSSCYRLQINAGFTLWDAIGVLDYLQELGVGAVYLSPLMQSTTGSDHGYDTVDVTCVDPARGGDEAFAAFSRAARAHGLQVVVDIVPNHMGISKPWENTAWWDVLTHGPDSAYAAWFDIDWSQGPIVVPVLAADGDLTAATIEPSPDGHRLHWFEHQLPVTPGTYREGDAVADVASRQHWRLAPFTEGATSLNYRRFFAVSELAGVRQELHDVFDATHALVREWVAEDLIDGVRVDHPDGLVDPAGYLRRLRELIGPDRWLVAEKILTPGERLSSAWPIDGTVGYDALMFTSNALLDGAQEDRFTALYRELTADALTCHEWEVLSKREVADRLFTPELRRLARLVPDLPADDVVAALGDVASEFEVYRTYLPADPVALRDAAERAMRRYPEHAATTGALVPRLSEPGTEVAIRFQQLTGPVMAKGVEDTAFYRHARFIALNEVGGDPDVFGLTLDQIHEALAERQAHAPTAMTCLSTHDTKRGEDVRAMLCALTEIPDEWERFARLFVARAGIDNPRFAYFLAQTLAGVGPIERTRLGAYLTKAMREASEETTWEMPDVAFEGAVAAAVALAFDDDDLGEAWRRLRDEQRDLGWSTSLSSKVLHLTMPGIPDVYRGTEVWDDSLVDPDNRRPVDFGSLASGLPDRWRKPTSDGRAKQWVVRQCLRARRDHPACFSGYTPLRATGPAADHCLAFDRGGAIAVVTRFPGSLAARGGWGSTSITLPSGRWVDHLSGRMVEAGEADTGVLVADLLADAPVALLLRS